VRRRLLPIETGVLWVVAVALSCLTAACSLYRPSGAPLPSSGEPQVGTSYRLNVYCSAPVRVGDSIWLFDDSDPWPPDEQDSMFGTIESPYAVRGVLTITAEDEAIFRADVDGSHMTLVRGAEADLGDACL
jgi:hypothetical protein